MQIKHAATNYFRGCDRGYRIKICRANGQRYRLGDFDFLAVLLPKGDWYIIPFEMINRLQISLPGKPSKKRNRFAKYREAWHLFE